MESLSYLTLLKLVLNLPLAVSFLPNHAVKNKEMSVTPACLAAWSQVLPPAIIFGKCYLSDNKHFIYQSLHNYKWNPEFSSRLSLCEEFEELLFFFLQTCGDHYLHHNVVKE